MRGVSAAAGTGPLHAPRLLLHSLFCCALPRPPPQEVADFIQQRDGYPSNPEHIFLTGRG